jgi:hypothetical protein
MSDEQKQLADDSLRAAIEQRDMLLADFRDQLKRVRAERDGLLEEVKEYCHRCAIGRYIPGPDPAAVRDYHAAESDLHHHSNPARSPALNELCKALGLFAGARGTHPEHVFEECLAAIKTLRELVKLQQDQIEAMETECFSVRLLAKAALGDQKREKGGRGDKEGAGFLLNIWDG